MRSQRTVAEKKALSAFGRALAAKGIAPLWTPAFLDSPDAVFKIYGRPVAIECRYATHPELMRFLGKRDMPADRPLEVLLPTEPHLWVKDAIDDKSPKVLAKIARF